MLAFRCPHLEPNREAAVVLKSRFHARRERWRIIMREGAIWPMMPEKLQAKVILDRLNWVQRMLLSIRNLPLGTVEDFTANPHTPAAAESYLRRGLEATLDLGRHIVAKGLGPAPAEYKSIAQELKDMGVLKSSEAHLLWRMAGYRDRLVHFYHEVSVEELYEICAEGLGDIERVTAALERWLRDHPERMDHEL